MYGPAGAAIWSAPTVDARRKLIYVGTGDSFTDIPTGATDSIVAMDMETGKIKWVMQATAHDNYLFGCNTPGKGICPDPVGPDYDFGASPDPPQAAGRQADDPRRTEIGNGLRA